MPGALRVIATAGHVDHGKSALIVALTGIDPDRFAEEKRRGLTIDLGYAWTTLPSGHEVGFVDVPGHERFIRNMLAGVGPVRLVLFVVAADEGWKPQSEEHLQILDVLGVAGGVVALTKRDLVDDESLEVAVADTREHLAGSVLAEAPIVPVSAKTGAGLDDVRAALDRMVAAAPAPPDARSRLFVDRVFTISGAGTVVTGTLTGGCLRVDDEVRLHPGDVRARIRSLQSHKRDLPEACHVLRVAANLAGVERAPLARGAVLCAPGSFRPTTTVDALLRPVRGLDRIPERGSYLVHAGASETAARLRVLERRDDGACVARLRTDDPLVLDVLDRVVVWESGRRRTVGGGVVLDVAPPAATERHVAYLWKRAATDDRASLVALAIHERGAVRGSDLREQFGLAPAGTGEWVVSSAVLDATGATVTAFLAALHAERPLVEGAALGEVRAVAAEAARAAGAPRNAGIAEAVLDAMHDDGSLVRTATTVRLATHEVALAGHEAELDRLLAAVSGDVEATPPTVKELVQAGFDPELIDAAAGAGIVVRIAPDLVVAPALVQRAVALVRGNAAEGLTVSRLRETLGTSRKYAVPLAEWMDANGKSRRVGDLRFPRDDAADAAR